MAHRPVGVNQTHRRTWDKDAFQKRAEERAQREKDGEEVEDTPDTKKKRKKKAVEIVNLSELKPVEARETAIDWDTHVGKRVGVTDPQQGGFFCDVCKVTLKDSNTYLDHLNGKSHLRAAGASLQPERATLQQVREKLKMAKTKKQEKEEEEDIDYDLKIQQLAEENKKKQQQLEQEEKKRKKDQAILKRKEAAQKELEDSVDPELIELGLPLSFGGSKK